MSLVADLQKRAKQSGKSGKVYKKNYSVWDIPDLTLSGWKFNEWDYYSDRAKLPTMARGLFTLGDDVVVRGYNKFFSIGETKATKLDAIEKECEGPYYATLKENGFLVLISGYKGQLIVTSKNSCGPSATTEEGKNYSRAAKDLVLKHLQSANRTEKEFADFLETNGWTAVGEGCDDSFEQHILPYSPEQAGIYLNGLNKNSADFITENPAKVLEVATDFGFKQTKFLKFTEFDKMMSFLKECEKTGSYEGREIEGFVIRCKRTDKEGALTDFFFKYKFEEPYLMYREWREVTKIYLQNGALDAIGRAKRSKHSSSSLNFITFARSYFKDNEERVNLYLKHNLGIIEMREAFLKSSELSEAELLKLDLSDKNHGEVKYLLVTVATLGCGKSTVANMLTELSKGKWTHRQNDEVTAKKKFPALVSSILSDFESHDVVILDRNNSSGNEREQIISEFDKSSDALGYNFKYICLNFLPNGVDDQSKSITRDRVKDRGDNHLTIKASTMTDQKIQGIMRQFESRFQVVNKEKHCDEAFELIIDLSPGKSIQNTKTILNSLNTKYPGLIEMPTDEEVTKAFEKVVHEKIADNNTPSSTDKPGQKTGSKQKPPQKKSEKGVSNRTSYFSVQINSKDYKELMEFVKQNVNDFANTYTPNKEFHVTLCHKAAHANDFQTFKDNYQPGRTQNVEITELGWTDKAVAFKVKTPNCSNEYPHITVGLNGVPAKDAQLVFKGPHESVPYSKVLENCPVKAMN